VDDVLTYAKDPEWARFLSVPQPYAKNDAEQFIAVHLSADRKVDPAWAIERQGRVIGGIDLWIDLPNRVAEMGYSIARDLWGQGYTTEAAKAIIDNAFSHCPKLNRIKAMADPRNPASIRVMEKIGMTWEGVLRQNRVIKGEIVDESWSGILRTEWQTNEVSTD
jgi:ribosomal-protein-alanine N-acetyltransferase